MDLSAHELVPLPHVEPAKSRGGALAMVDPRIMRSLANNSVMKLPIPIIGTWSGERGNSWYTLPDDATITFWMEGKRRKASGYEIRQFMVREYGVDSVRYESGDPDFSPFIDGRIGSVTIEGFTSNRDANFRKATARKARELGCTSKQIRQEMRSRNLVWHECIDRTTLLAIPARIHAAFPHGGGIAIEDSLAAIRSKMNRLAPNGFTLASNTGMNGAIVSGLDEAIQSMKRSHRLEKRKIRDERHSVSNNSASDSIGTKELAERYGVTQATIQKWCRSGRLTGMVKAPNGRWVASPSTFLQNRNEKEPAQDS